MASDDEPLHDVAISSSSITDAQGADARGRSPIIDAADRGDTESVRGMILGGGTTEVEHIVRFLGVRQFAALSVIVEGALMKSGVDARWRDSRSGGWSAIGIVRYDFTNDTCEPCNC